MSEPTYNDVAQWLPTDVREHIETTTPCPVYGKHYWQHSRDEVYVAERREPVRVIEQWYCPCGLVHTTDPEKRR